MLFFRENKQLQAIFEWLGALINKDEIILVEQKGKREYYHFKFFWKAGEKPKKIKSFEKDPSFLVRVAPFRLDFNRNAWREIFKMPELELYESKKRQKGLETLSDSWSELQKKEILSLIRKTINLYLKEGKLFEDQDFNSFKNLSDVLFIKRDFYLALWTEGRLRGLSVIENKNLNSEIKKAILSIFQNKSFKPLELSELEKTRIEIGFISALKIPLSKKLIDKNEIFYNKGYLAQGQNYKNWFVPVLFNTKKYKNLREVIDELAPRDKCKIFIFEVDNYLENKKPDEILYLGGPIAIIKENYGLDTIVLKAADWLIKSQESDGNFIPIFNPLNGVSSQIDWTRSALSGWSLTELGKKLKKEKYIEAGKKSFFYLSKYLLSGLIEFNQTSYFGISLAFLGELAISLEYWQESFQIGVKILDKNIISGTFEPASFSQIGNFLANLAKKDKQFLEPAERYARIIQEKFESNLKNNIPMILPAWAGLAELNLKISVLTDDFAYLQNAKKIIDWLLGRQLENGSFLTVDNSNYVYVRGTGKIAESLASVFLIKRQRFDSIFDLAYYKKCLEKSFEWIKQMQYSPENSYFIPEKNLNSVFGGFRHDYLNPDLWIDSAAHFILAVSRFLNHK
ncbi:MAG: hypothetical protein NTV77_03805 [Candidatus Azambacteria bacterium]|nr:hypothetical protein [Candidatus Azambacteria bacterium]